MACEQARQQARCGSQHYCDMDRLGLSLGSLDGCLQMQTIALPVRPHLNMSSAPSCPPPGRGRGPSICRLSCARCSTCIAARVPGHGCWRVRPGWCRNPMTSCPASKTKHPGHPGDSKLHACLHCTQQLASVNLIDRAQRPPRGLQATHLERIQRVVQHAVAELDRAIRALAQAAQHNVVVEQRDRRLLALQQGG